METSIDDFDELRFAPAPECEKRMISKIYHLCIHLASFLAGNSTTLGQKKYLDLIFFCLCRKNVSGVFLAVTSDGISIPHMYCCLLAPSMYLLKIEQQVEDLKKLKDEMVSFHVSYDTIPEELFFLPSTGKCFEDLCKIYKVRPCSYQYLSSGNQNMTEL